MQGRLLPPEKGRFQAFPREHWPEEFARARQVPLHAIEWIVEAYGADVNPVMQRELLPCLQKCIAETGVEVGSICADIFMDRPFLRCSSAEREERELLLQHLIRTGSDLGMQRIVLPFVDASRIESADDRATVIGVIEGALPAARAHGIELHLETSLGPAPFAELLDHLADARVKANYDSGNSASLGYSPDEEFRAYGERIGSIHLKDRLRGGGTVPLGTGDTDFAAVFAAMDRASYSGDLILQAARGESGDEVAWNRRNRAFVARYWPLQ